VSEIIYHHGIKGQKWGVRRFQNEDGTLTTAGKKRINKDMNKIEKAIRKAGKATAKYLDFTSSHTYSVSGMDGISSVYIDNPRLRKNAEKYGKKVDKLLEKLQKKYSTVSAIPNKDSETGKMYVDISIDNEKRRADDVE
jgi:hypothetical protein